MSQSEEANDISYVGGKTTLHTEKKCIQWTIEHINSLLEQRVPNVHFSFEMGDSIGVPCFFDIHLDLYPDPTSHNKARFVMTCVNKDRPNDNVSFRIDIRIMHRAQLLHSAEGEKKFMGPWLTFLGTNMKDDIAVVKLKVTVFGNEAVATATYDQAVISATLKYESMEKVSEDMQNLFDSGHNSDFVIKVPSVHASSGYESFKVHKMILAARSDVFKTMLETPMPESLSGEATYDDLSPNGLKILLKYLYTGIVDENWKNNVREVVDVANRFALPTLKKFVDINLHSLCDANNVIDLLQLTKVYGLPTAFRNVVSYIQANTQDIANEL